MLELPAIYAENIHRWLPELLYYSLTTLKIAFVSFLLAVAVGIFFAVCRTSGSRFLRGFAVVYIEIARGLPIVASAGGAAAETVPDGAALKVPPGDAAALGRALRQAIESRDLRAALGDAAWAAGRGLPRWPETARKVAAALREVGR